MAHFLISTRLMEIISNRHAGNAKKPGKPPFPGQQVHSKSRVSPPHRSVPHRCHARTSPDDRDVGHIEHAVHWVQKDETNRPALDFRDDDLTFFKPVGFDGRRFGRERKSVACQVPRPGCLLDLLEPWDIGSVTRAKSHATHPPKVDRLASKRSCCPTVGLFSRRSRPVISTFAILCQLSATQLAFHD
jgi:hypothetical protein